jgi:hypothetical protein
MESQHQEGEDWERMPLVRSPLSHEELARRTGAKPIWNPEDWGVDLMEGFFESDEELEEFLVHYRRRRREGTRPESYYDRLGQ